MPTTIYDLPSRWIFVKNLFDVFLEPHVGKTGVFRLVHHDALAGLVDVVVHSEVSGASMDQHAMVARHRREFVVGLTEQFRS